MTDPRTGTSADAAGPFAGFGEKALPFLKALGFHQDRDWFRENRAIYDEAVLEPLRAFVTALDALCRARGLPIQGTARTSPYRVYRDVRFSREKHPFNTHASALLTRSGLRSDPGGYYIHLSPTRCFEAVGFWELDPPRIAALRQAMLAAPARLAALEAGLAGHGLAFEQEGALRRAPREAAGVTDPALLAALKLKSLAVLRPIDPASITRPDLAERAADFIDTALPLLDYGWSALATLAPARG